MISGQFISSICKAFFHIYDLDIGSVPTNFGVGFCIEFTDTNFGSIIYYYILHPISIAWIFGGIFCIQILG